MVVMVAYKGSVLSAASSIGMAQMGSFALYTLYHNKKEQLGLAVCLWGDSRVADVKSCCKIGSVSYQRCSPKLAT